MDYLSVCSGIEAATVAWHPIGWTPAAFAEIEAFPRALLAQRYPEIPNLGDITEFQGWPDLAIDLLVGGTPCQSFSVAGLRAGMADPRGNLALVYLAIADRYRPRWLVWENVPGVFSIDDGRAFGSIIGGLAKLGYGFAYRVLDAQYCRVDGFPRAVPQRRRRVFVVGCARGWRRAAAVLFDAASLSGDSSPRRQAGQGAAHPIEASLGRRCGQPNDHDPAGGLIPLIANPLTERMHKGVNTTMDEGQTMVAHALTHDGFDAGEDGTGRGTPLVVADPLSANEGRTYTHRRLEDDVNIVAFAENQRAEVLESDIVRSLVDGGGKPGQGYPAIRQGFAVRRLTPRECERLQGFPDDYTAISWRGKPAADGPRYKALGNSFAVNVVRWLGRRIELVERRGGGG